MTTATATSEFISVRDALSGFGFSRPEPLTSDDVVCAGHFVFMAVDGKSYNISVAKREDIDEYQLCPKCHEPHTFGWVKAPQDVGGDFISVRCLTETCRLQREANQCGMKLREKEARAIQRAGEENYLKRFGVPEGYWKCTLDNFRNNGTFRDSVHCALAASQFVNSADVRAFLVTGNTGVGKTHIAVGIMRRIAEAGGQQNMRFESVAAIMARFKESYAPQSERSEHDLIREYAGYSVLVMDDLGVENRTDNSIALVQQLVDERCAMVRGKLVITSNLTVERLSKMYGDRMLSRLTGTTGRVLNIVAPDYRKTGGK